MPKRVKNAGMIIQGRGRAGKMEVEITDVKPRRRQFPVLIYYNWCKGAASALLCPTGCLGRRADGSPYVANPENASTAKPVTLCPDYAITGAKDR